MEPKALKGGLHEFVVRAIPLRASYRLQLSQQFAYLCEYKYEVENLRPCAHVLSAIDAAYKHTKAEAFNVWYARWLTPVWLAEMCLKQHTHPVKHATVLGSALNQAELIPAELLPQSGRKRKRP